MTETRVTLEDFGECVERKERTVEKGHKIERRDMEKNISFQYKILGAFSLRNNF